MSLPKPALPRPKQLPKKEKDISRDDTTEQKSTSANAPSAHERTKLTSVHGKRITETDIASNKQIKTDKDQRTLLTREKVDYVSGSPVNQGKNGKPPIMVDHRTAILIHVKPATGSAVLSYEQTLYSRLSGWSQGAHSSRASHSSQASHSSAPPPQ